MLFTLCSLVSVCCVTLWWLDRRDEALSRQLSNQQAAHERLCALVERVRLSRITAPFELVRPAQRWDEDDYATRDLSAPDTFPRLRF